MSRLQSDDGSGSLEFIAIMAALFLPLLYVVLTVSSLHAAHAAAAHAAREAGRIFMSSDSATVGYAQARAAVSLALNDQRINDVEPELTFNCEGPCLSPGSVLRVVVQWNHPLPWVPPVFNSASAWPVREEQALWIDDFRPQGGA